MKEERLLIALIGFDMTGLFWYIRLLHMDQIGHPMSIFGAFGLLSAIVSLVILMFSLED